MKFLVTCFDKKNSLNLRLANREEHIKYIGKIGEKLILAGPILDDQDNPSGTVLILNFKDLDVVKRFLNDEGKPKTEWFVNDQLHLNKLGYAEWSNIIKDAINREIPLF